MGKRDLRPAVYVPRVGTEITWRKRRVRIVEVVQDASTNAVIGVRITNLGGIKTAYRAGLQSSSITTPSALEKILKEAQNVEGI
jgi:hypothetical protein